MILETGMSRDISSCLVQISSSLAMGSSGVGLSLNVHRPVNISIRMVPEPSATSIGFDPVSRQPQNIWQTVSAIHCSLFLRMVLYPPARVFV
jgi:hypothetical protein